MRRKKPNNPKKTCVLLMKAMKEDHSMGKGTLLKATVRNSFVVLNVGINEHGIIVSHGKDTYSSLAVEADSCLVFLDVVYDSRSNRHFFRFLFGEKIIGMPYERKGTIKLLKRDFEVLYHGTS
jgi:hypothetical protein